MHKLKGLSEVVEFLGKNDNFVVVGDYDADGITGSSIIGMALKRLSKDFRILQSRAVNYEKLEIAKGLGDNYVFVDFGSGIVSLLEKTFPRLNFAVIDHHEPEKVGEFPHFNVHLSGYNGATDLSSSGSAYFVARELGDNKDLCTIAVVGAVGDMQDSKGKLEGLNLEVLKDGKENDLIEIRKDIRIFGRHSRPLTQFLSYCTEPFFPGLSANENASREFLKDLGIKLTDGAGGDKWRYYCDLSGDEKKRLVSALYVYGKDKEIPEFVLKTLVGEVYELKKEKDRTELKDTREFSTLLNACGRHDRAELGLAVCMGDRGEAFEKARGVLLKHRRMLRDGIEFVQKAGVKELENLYYFDGQDQIKDTVIGIIAGMLYGAAVIKNDKPVLASVIDKEGKAKFSMRGTWSLVRKGLDIGKVMHEASRFGGVGGGHVIAGGCTVPADKKEEFILEVNRILAP